MSMESARQWRLAKQARRREQAAALRALVPQDTTPKPVTLPVVVWLLRTTNPKRLYATVPKDT